MRQTPRRIFFVIAALAAGWAAVAWPHVNDVETGRTPEYPDLMPRDLSAPPPAVSKVAQASIERLSGWRVVGTGHGPGGSRIQAETRVLPFLPIACEVTVRIQREGGKTRLTVRSQSRYGPWDFGQNARNIRAFLAELDREGS